MARPFFQAKIIAVWIFLVWERLGIARDLNGAPQDRNFTVKGSKSLADEITLVGADAGLPQRE